MNSDLYCCDNLELMKTIESNTIDLIYCDILYGTGRKFKDYQDLKPIRSEIENHYIPRVKEMYRILKDTGSIYLQMDTRINHWIRCLMDEYFGYNNFRNEICWGYRTGGMKKTEYPKKHDIILFYTKTKKYIFKLERTRKQYVDKTKGYDPYIEYFKDDIGEYTFGYDTDLFIIDNFNHKKQRLYDTQKPKELIAKFIKASSNENDLVADFYAGSFTTAEVCKDLNRNFIGCDINTKAVEIGHKRIKDSEQKPCKTRTKNIKLCNEPTQPELWNEQHSHSTC